MSNTTKKTIQHPKTIGLIMPLSTMDEFHTAEHWDKVRKCLSKSMFSGCCTKMVSDVNESKMITNTIMHNLHSNDIVVCDITCNNPNVMFELGIRIAFDKPVIVIKEKNDQNAVFDVSHIKYIEYPKDLNMPEMMKFFKSLKSMVQAAFKKQQDSKSMSILQQYGIFIKPIKDGNEELMKAINFINSELGTFEKRMSRQDYLLDKINMTVNKDQSHYKGSFEPFGCLSQTKQIMNMLEYKIYGTEKTLPDDGKLY